MESGPLHASLLANDVGVGKTITYLASIIMRVRRMAEAQSTGQQSCVFRPTLVMLPMPLIRQVFSECTRYFGRFISAYVYYGSPDRSNEKEGLLKGSIIRSRDLGRFMARMDTDSDKVAVRPPPPSPLPPSSPD